MTRYLLVITLSWLSSVRPQYINTGGPGADSVLDSLGTPLRYPYPYVNYNMPPTQLDIETYQNDAMGADSYNQFDRTDDDGPFSQSQRRRRSIAGSLQNEKQTREWLPNLLDKDKTVYIRSEDKMAPYIQSFGVLDETNGTADIGEDAFVKRSFSPWGGKRDHPSVLENMWTWKRNAGIREPSMPKRVRFSPWGGKRSGQLIYKPGSKGTKIILSSLFGPEFTRFITKLSPYSDSIDLAGFQIIPSIDKRHPIKILALSTQMGDSRSSRDANTFNKFFEAVPKMFKPGHPYADVNLNKDGKRKVKFSTWGGKRSPPIIGPIWTPSSQHHKDSTINTILLIKNKDRYERMASAKNL